MMRYIDLGGTSYSGPKIRVWMIDPIDGTKWYWTGGPVCRVRDPIREWSCESRRLRMPAHHSPSQVWLCRKVTLPILPQDIYSNLRREKARRGAQSWRPLSTGALAGPSADVYLTPQASKICQPYAFCENVNTTGPQFAHRELVAEKLSAPWSPIHIYSTQLRYIALALRACGVVLRMPLPDDKMAHVWDHAGG